jgi:hypothetical protein
MYTPDYPELAVQELSELSPCMERTTLTENRQ